MDSAKIAIQIVPRVDVIEAATTDVVAVEVVLAEVDAPIVMTAKIVAFPSMHHLLPLARNFCTDLISSQRPRQAS